MSKVVVDIGGSGARFGQFTGNNVIGICRHDVRTIEQLTDTVRYVAGGRVEAVGLSVPGYVNAKCGTVRRSWAASYLEGDLRSRLMNLFETKNVHIVNDGEAHALCMLRYPDIQFGAICVSIGTSIGFGVIGQDRKPVRTLGGENWDLSNHTLKTRASDPHVYWALGSQGLDELKKVRGGDAYRYFGWRLGAFLSQLIILLRPQTIGLTGGIIHNHWTGDMERETYAELQKDLDGLDVPSTRIFALKEQESALYGVASLI